MRRWSLLALLIPLTACGNLYALRQQEIQGEDFNTLLALEYQDFAESEAELMDWRESEYFAKKGLAALHNKPVEPESLEERDIDPIHLAELTTARKQLLEALTAASVGLLTIYDMCKAVDRAMRIEAVMLFEKEGGKSGHFVNPAAP